MSLHPIDAFLLYFSLRSGIDGLDLRLRVYAALAVDGDWDRRRLKATLQALLVYHPEQQRAFAEEFDTFFKDEVPPQWLRDPLTPKQGQAVGFDARRAFRELCDAARPQPIPASREGPSHETTTEVAASPSPQRSEPSPAVHVHVHVPIAEPTVAHPTARTPDGRIERVPAQEGKPTPSLWQKYKAAPRSPDDGPVINTVTQPGASPRQLLAPGRQPQTAPPKLRRPEASEPEQLELDYRGTQEVRPFLAQDLEDLAFSMPIHQLGEELTIDMAASISRTAQRGGLWNPVYRCLKHLLRLWIVVPFEIDEISDLAVRKAVAGLREHGIQVELSYGAWPWEVPDALFIVLDVRRVVLDPRPSRSNDWARWSSHPRVQFIEARDVGLWGAELRRFPHPVHRLDLPGLRMALEAALSPVRPSALPLEVALGGEPQERLGDTLPLAAAMAVAAPCDVATADQLRREFTPQLPFLRIQRVAQLRGVVADPTGWHFSADQQEWLFHRVGVDFRRRVLRWQLRRLEALTAKPKSQAWLSRERELAIVRLQLACLSTASPEDGSHPEQEAKAARAIETLLSTIDKPHDRRRLGERGREIIPTLPMATLSLQLFQKTFGIMMIGLEDMPKEAVDAALKGALSRMQRTRQSYSASFRRLPAKGELPGLPSARLIDSLPMTSQFVLSARLDSSQTRVLATGSGHNAYLWDLAKREFLAIDRHASGGHTGWVTSAVFSRDEKRIITASWDQTARVWDAATAGELHRISIGYRVRYAEENADGQAILVIGNEGSLAVCLVATEELEWPFKEDVWLARFLQGQEELLVITKTAALLWDARRGTAVRRAESPWLREPILSVAFSPNHRWAVLGGKDGGLLLLDLQEFTFVRRLSGHQGRIKAIAVSQSGDYILSGAEDGTVRLWDTRYLTEQSCLDTRSQKILAMEFTKTGFCLVGVYDGNQQYTGLPLALRLYTVDCDLSEG